ncbi:MAG: OPT/YSL family transporter [Candidatus Micrarchaeota archaeon]
MFRFPLSARALLLGAALSMAVAAYSAFAGLKVGGVYWPIVTTSLISLFALRALGKTDKNEINIMQTAGSSGGLLAAGIIFTIPAALMLGLTISYLQILIISLLGGILGIVFSFPLRKQLIEREKLPCADGTAAAALVEAGDAGGKKAVTLMYAFGIGAALSIARDWAGALPAAINLNTLKLGVGKIFSLGSSVSLIPLAGGYLIGRKFTSAWFLGAIFTYFIVMPYALTQGIFPSKAEVVSEVARPLGVGIVLGAAIIYFLLKGMPMLGNMASDWRKAKAGRIGIIALLACAFVLTFVFEMGPVLSAIVILGAFAMAYVGARSTAEMNVNPMEIFAMLVLIIAKIVLGIGALPLIILAAVVTISAGLAGDMMQDLKSGYLLGTKLEHQIVAQVVGMLAASFAIGAVLISLSATHGFGTLEFPAPQAIAVKELVQVGGLSGILVFGIAAGAVLTAIFAYFKPSLGIGAIAFGIGIYVPIELSLPLFAGGMLRHYFDRTHRTEKGRLIAAGVIAGEGIAGVAFSLIGFAAALFA